MYNSKLIYESIETRSGKVGYVKIGEHLDSIVMLVGYTGTLFHWNKEFVLLLAKYYTVYLIDNRFIGLSESINPNTMHGFALDVRDFIDAKNLKKPYVLGWSMGGAIVQELSLIYAHNLSGIILMSTVPNLTKCTNFEFTNLLIQYKRQISTINTHNITDNKLVNANNDLYHIKNLEFKKQLHFFFFSDKSYHKTKNLIITNALNFENYSYRLESKAKELQDQINTNWSGVSELQLMSIKLPALVLWAKNDMVVNHHAIEFFTHLPNSTFNIYKTGAHFLIHRYPTKVASDILKFINNINHYSIN